VNARRWEWAALLVVLSGCGSRTEPEPLFLGQVLPLSGRLRQRGEQSRRGVRLAVEEALAAEVRSAGRPLAVRHADDRGEAELARAEATRLLAVNRVPALLGDFEPALNEVLSRTVQPSGVPLLIPGDLAEPSRADNVFGLGLPPADRGRALAKYAVEELKATRAAVLLREGDAVALALADAFSDEWKQDRDRQLIRESMKRDVHSAEALTAVVARKPEVILLATDPADFAQLRRLLPSDRPLLYGGMDLGPSALAGEKDGTVYLATVYCRAGLTDRGKEFAQRYEKAFGEPPDLVAAQSYDGVRLLFEALAKAGPTAAKVREHLSGLEDWESATGALSLKDHRTRRPLFVVRLHSGEEKLIKTIAKEEKK
jgi:branched-chain amino acid transport system substrate-binding protein